MPTHDDALWRELDALGEHQVRVRLAQGVYRDKKRSLVEEWLRQQNNKRELYASRGAPSAEQVRIDRGASKIEIVAATAAIIAALMATIAATVSVLSYLR